MIIPSAVLYVLNGVGMLCCLALLVSAGLQSAPPSSYSVRFKLQRTILLFLLGLAAVEIAVLAFGTPVPAGYRIGW